MPTPTGRQPARDRVHSTVLPVATDASHQPIDRVMTSQPVTIGRGEALATAHELMRDNGIRHLPVLEHGELVGVLSQRDLYFLETIAGVDLDKDLVDDAMSTDAYAVSPNTLVGDVAREMANHKYGCAVVLERERVVGIFTATDALRLLATPGRART